MPEQPTETADPRSGEGFYPIRTVASLTGVNPITLRAWERRYGLIKPHRTPKGHRLYTQADVDLINQVVQLLERGIAISRVRPLLEAEAVGGEESETSANDPWPAYHQRMYTAITRFDELALDTAYNEALALYPVDTVTEYLLLPLMRQLGSLWDQRDSGIAEEHFFATYLRNKLGARFHHLNHTTSGPRLITACLPGERHELGLLLFCLSAAARNYRTVMFGADIPLRQLALAGGRTDAAALVLSSSMPPSRRVLDQELPELVAAVPMPVYVGGDTSIRHHDAILRAGATPLGSDLGPALRRLDDHLANING